MMTNEPSNLPTLRVLCLEDSAYDAEIIRESLGDAGFSLSFQWTSTRKEFEDLLKTQSYDIILSDFRLPGFDAFAALALSSEHNPQTPFICVSGSIGEETAIELLKHGALDYILKDRLSRLPFAVTRALSEAREKEARRVAEEQIRASLREKEIMLKEIHHRVKNNMQVISSMLNLELQRNADPAVHALFVESINRIRTMALVHERLYRSGTFTAVEFKGFLTQVAADLHRFYNVQGVESRVEAEDLSLGIDLAIPCGMLVNELLSNALKHAFVGRSSGLVTVRLRRLIDGLLELMVEDSGVGIPEGDALRDVSSVGMTLVNALVTQIDGKMTIERNNGTKFTITFAG
jgi:two-component sensor histidine kinase